MPEELSSSQDRILHRIKRAGPQSIKALSDHLDMTTMGVRQHISQMEETKLIQPIQGDSSGRGRPKKNWRLTKAGHNQFPDAHAAVTTDLILSVRDLLGEAALDQLIDKRTQDTRASYLKTLAPIESLEDKLQALCDIRIKEGYMAELQKDEEGFILNENHCPICVAAQQCHGFCRSELEVFQAAVGPAAKIERVEYLLTGDRRCSYRITPI